MPARCRIPAAIIILGILTTQDAGGGEIPGTPSQAPPTFERDLELNFSNDFLGRGGSVDDFRTQQIIVSARFAEDWIALLDHSILTLDDATVQNRLDQLSGSVGYRLINDSRPGSVNWLTLGGGFRSSGEFAGERMQNGFHRLIGSDVVTLSYVDTSRTDATFWLDGEIYRRFGPAGGTGYFKSWDAGYWIRGNTLITSDGQWDSGLGAYAVASRNSVDIWLGLRQDWRAGYERDAVQIATAEAEQDLAVVLGIRVGALLLETVQQTSNQASYGQLRFISSGQRPFPQSSEWPRMNFEFAIVLPDVQAQLAGKFRSMLFASSESAWRESILIEAMIGEPQFASNTSVYVRSRQLTVGFEWERRLSAALPWISAYGALSGGLRSEQLVGDNALADQVSSTISRGVLDFAGGLRFNAANLGSRGWYRLQLGAVAWVPVSDAIVVMNGESFRIQKPALGISLGMTFDFQ